jgi:hypothetical protein
MVISRACQGTKSGAYVSATFNSSPCVRVIRGSQWFRQRILMRPGICTSCIPWPMRKIARVSLAASCITPRAAVRSPTKGGSEKTSRQPSSSGARSLEPIMYHGNDGEKTFPNLFHRQTNNSRRWNNQDQRKNRKPRMMKVTKSQERKEKKSSDKKTVTVKLKDLKVTKNPKAGRAKIGPARCQSGDCG